MNNKKNLKYILYARKSTESEDKQVASIESQINVMKEKAESLGLNITKVMHESSSGYKPGRKVFNEMLELIKEGKADGIICWKLSRLSRNPDDAGKIIGMLQRSEIQHIRTNDRDWYPDDQVVMIYVEFGITNQYSKDLSADTRRGLEQKAKRGWYPIGMLPLGYMHNKYLRLDEKEIIPSPDFPLIKRAFQYVASREMTTQHASKWLASKNIKGTRNNKPLTYSTFFKMLSNEFYYGKFVYNNTPYIGKHERMISKEDYDTIQSIIRRPDLPRSQIYEFAFTGLMKCGECGCGITAQHKTKYCKNGNIHRYIYYNCTKKRGPCKQPSIEEELLEKQMLEILKRIRIMPEFKDWVIDELRKDNELVIAERNSDRARINQQYENTVKNTERLVDKFTQDLIPEEIYKSKLAELQAEKLRLELLRRDEDDRVDDWIEKVNKVFEYSITASEKFIKGDIQTKKQIIFALGSNLVLKDKKVHINLPKPLYLIENMPLEMKTQLQSLEPMQTIERMEQINALSQNEILWRD